MKIHKKICPLCKKEFTSVHRKVVENNYSIHIGACKERYKKAPAEKLLDDTRSTSKESSTEEKTIAEEEEGGGTSPKFIGGFC